MIAKPLQERPVSVWIVRFESLLKFPAFDLHRHQHRIILMMLIKCHSLHQTLTMQRTLKRTLKKKKKTVSGIQCKMKANKKRAFWSYDDKCQGWITNRIDLTIQEIWSTIFTQETLINWIIICSRITTFIFETRSLLLFRIEKMVQIKITTNRKWYVTRMRKMLILQNYSQKRRISSAMLNSKCNITKFTVKAIGAFFLSALLLFITFLTKNRIQLMIIIIWYLKKSTINYDKSSINYVQKCCFFSFSLHFINCSPINTCTDSLIIIKLFIFYKIPGMVHANGPNARSAKVTATADEPSTSSGDRIV